MTNEEAISVLEDYDINFERHTAEAIAEAHEMAIEALEAQPSERTEEHTEMHECDLEQIIKTTIKEYLDKDCDDVVELLLTLNKDLCERIRKERINGI